jgi:hypothetical protein
MLNGSSATRVRQLRFTFSVRHTVKVQDCAFNISGACIKSGTSQTRIASRHTGTPQCHRCTAAAVRSVDASRRLLSLKEKKTKKKLQAKEKSTASTESKPRPDAQH